MRAIVAVAVLTAGIVLATSAGAQPGPGPDVKKIEAEIQKLKAVLAEAEARFRQAKKGTDFDKGPEFGKGPFGGFGRGGFDKEKEKAEKGKEKTEKGKEKADKGKEKEKASDADRVLAELRRILAEAERKETPEGPRGFGGMFGRREFAKEDASIEKRLTDLEKAVEEIRRELKRR